MISRPLMISVATSATVALLVASIPARALPIAKSVSRFSTSAVKLQGKDDDDDGLSGGALAVLLLAIGGAVAGVLYASTRPAQGVPNRGGFAINKADSNTISVKTEKSGSADKRSQSEWTAKLDRRSQTILVTTNEIDRTGRHIHSYWTGKVDGKFYPVTGDPRADEWSFTKIDARTVKFIARKLGRVTLTGQLAVSADQRSYTINRN